MGLCHSVQESDVAILERFGKFDGVAGAGCLCTPFPCIRGLAGTVSMRLRQLNLFVETKTKDNVFVNVEVAVQFEVLPDKVYDAYYKLSSPVAQINSFVFDVVRAAVPVLPIDDLFETKDHIADQVQIQLEQQMRDFGFKIIEVLIVDINPDPKVKSAMNEINASRRLRVAAQEKAEADKITLVKAAEAEAESKCLQGEGTARQRKAITDGLQNSVHEFSHEVDGLSPKDVMELILLTQYFDLVKDVGTKNSGSTLYMAHNPGGLTTLYKEIKAVFSESGSDEATQSSSHRGQAGDPMTSSIRPHMVELSSHK